MDTGVEEKNLQLAPSGGIPGLIGFQGLVEKTKHRILAVLLVFALLATGLPVLTYAADGSSDEGTAAPGDTGDGEEASFTGTVLYNRNYEEGWQYNNGLYTSSAMKKHVVSVDHETTRDGDYNYFVYICLKGRCLCILLLRIDVSATTKQTFTLFNM